MCTIRWPLEQQCHLYIPRPPYTHHSPGPYGSAVSYIFPPGLPGSSPSPKLGEHDRCVGLPVTQNPRRAVRSSSQFQTNWYPPRSVCRLVLWHHAQWMVGTPSISVHVHTVCQSWLGKCRSTYNLPVMDGQVPIQCFVGAHPLEWRRVRPAPCRLTHRMGPQCLPVFNCSNAHPKGRGLRVCTFHGGLLCSHRPLAFSKPCQGLGRPSLWLFREKPVRVLPGATYEYRVHAPVHLM